MGIQIYLCLICTLATGTVASVAQPLVDEVPLEYEEPVDEWVSEVEARTSAFHRNRFEDIYAEKISDGQIFAVASQMVSLFDALDWDENEPQQQKILNALQRFLRALEIALQSPGIEGPLDEKAEQNIFLEALNDQQFGLHSLTMETIADSSGEDVSGYFKETVDQILLYEWADDGERVRLLLTTEQLRPWRLLQNALSNLINQQVALVSEANILELRNAVERWENFLDRGYSQMPWESLLNGWWIGLPTRDFGPPNHQVVLLHPTIGIELSVDPLDETRVKEAMHLEVLGHIWYSGEQLEDYWGVSATVSLRDDLDPGIGLLLHIKRDWNLGVSWHDVDEDPFLFFSADLFSFAKHKAAKYVERYEGVRAQLELQ